MYLYAHSKRNRTFFHRPVLLRYRSVHSSSHLVAERARAGCHRYHRVAANSPLNLGLHVTRLLALVLRTKNVVKRAETSDIRGNVTELCIYGRVEHIVGVSQILTLLTRGKEGLRDVCLHYVCLEACKAFLHPRHR